jgi:hypothetical protein
LLSALILAAVASPEVADVKPALVARPERSPEVRVLVPRDEIVVSILSLRSFPILPPVVIPVVRASQISAAERSLSALIDALVASGDTAEARPADVARPEVAEVKPADVASGEVAVVMAPVIVDVEEVTFVAVARVERSDTFASEPDDSVLSVKLRVP